VPRENPPEQRVGRPGTDCERPAREVHARLGLREEAVGIVDRIVTAGELMPREPELPDRLQVVTRGGRAGESVKTLRHERVIGVLKRGAGRNEPGAEVERDDAGYKARAAERNSSKSGSSASSKAHAPRTVPPASIR